MADPSSCVGLALSFQKPSVDSSVKFLWHVQPTGISGDTTVRSLEITKLVPTEDGSLVPETGSEFSLDVDLVVLSIGQATHAEFLSMGGNADANVQLERGRVLIDRVTGQTTNPKFFAGGDCTNGGREVVDAVADGKRAGIGIAAWLEGKYAKA